MLWLLFGAILAVFFCIKLRRRGRLDFWRYVAKYPDVAYDFFLESSCWHVCVDNAENDSQYPPAHGQWDGPFRLCVPKLGGVVITIYGKVPEYRMAQQEFIDLVNLVKTKKPRSYLDIVTGLLVSYDHFCNQEDIIEYLESPFVREITDTTQMQSMDSMLPLPPGFVMNTYKIKELTNNEVILDTVFYNKRVVNLRCQLIVRAWNHGQFDKYVHDQLLPAISKIVGNKTLQYDSKTDCYYYSDYDGYIIAVRFIPEGQSVSVYLMDNKYA